MRPAFAALLMLSPFAGADRAPAKQPAYRGDPEYLLLLCGPDAKPVWLVRDGDALHVDRNADGDLTNDGLPARIRKTWAADADGTGLVREEGKKASPYKSLTLVLGPPARRGSAVRLEVVTDMPAAPSGRGVFAAGASGRELPAGSPFSRGEPPPLRFAANVPLAPAVRAGGALALVPVGKLSITAAFFSVGEMALETVAGPGEVPARFDTYFVPAGTRVALAVETPAAGGKRETRTFAAHPGGGVLMPAGDIQRLRSAPPGPVTVTATLDGWPGVGPLRAKYEVAAAATGRPGPPAEPAASKEYAGTLTLPADPRPLLVGAKSPAQVIAGGLAGVRAERRLAPRPWSVAFAPGGQLLVETTDGNFNTLGQSWEFSAWDADARRQLWRAPAQARPTDQPWPTVGARPLALSPDGQRLYAVRPAADPGRAELAAWDAATGAPQPAVPLGGDGWRDWGNRLSFSRDGRQLFAPGPAGVSVVDLGTGDVREVPGAADLLPAEGGAVALRPVGEGGLELARVGSAPGAAAVPAGRFAADAVSPDGSLVALYRRADGPAGRQFAVDFHDARTLEKRGEYVSPVAVPPGFFRFLAGGKAAVVGRDAADVRLIDVPSGKVAATLVVGTGLVSAVAATPDGRSLAVRWGHGADSTARATRVAVVDVAAAKVAHQLTGAAAVPPGMAEPLAIRADGRRVALGVRGGVQLFDLPP